MKIAVGFIFAQPRETSIRNEWTTTLTESRPRSCVMMTHENPRSPSPLHERYRSEIFVLPIGSVTSADPIGYFRLAISDRPLNCRSEVRADRQ
jgi:hypothetical protein